LLIEKEFQELNADEVAMMMRRYQKGGTPEYISILLEKGHTD